MESSLNEAHQQHRRADACLRSGRYDEAISYHQKAAELLKEAMQLTKADKALESLQLQYNFHIRQQAVITFKQRQAEKWKRVMQTKRTGANQRGDSEQTISPSGNAPDSIQYAIYRTMEENDSLLQFLRDKNGTSPITPMATPQSEANVFSNIGSRETSPEAARNQEEIIRSATKAPKNDKTIIEELEINNKVLRELVEKLIGELEMSKQTIVQLHSRLERQQIDEETASHKNASHLRVITDSSSPFVLSPCGELSPIAVRELPPLEMPNFDFNLLKTNSENS